MTSISYTVKRNLISYARARLWLGITGVGSIVLISTLLLSFSVPSQIFSTKPTSWISEGGQIFMAVSLVAVWLFPLDYLGGFYLPLRYQRQQQTLSRWLGGYLPAVIGQILFFSLAGSAILITNRQLGFLAVIVLLVAGVLIQSIFRWGWLFSKTIRSSEILDRLAEAQKVGKTWKMKWPAIWVVKHHDPGFTGGIVGLGPFSKIVLPESWIMQLTPESLVIAIARRHTAIQTGSYFYGLLFAMIWNLVGFIAAAFIVGLNFDSVAQLFTISCILTIWAFVGLLILPTFSRSCSLQVDNQLLTRHPDQITPDMIREAARKLDAWQDEEPERAKMIETIFHPIPSVNNRQPQPDGVVARIRFWNVARTSLAFSWPFLGFLSRAVHCNIGRPELWLMLPID